jgi:hypothetical protein
VAQAPLAPPLSTDGRFLLPLALGAGLLIETAFPEFGIEPGPLNLPFEPTKSPVEALIVLNDHFQTDHTPFEVFARQAL